MYFFKVYVICIAVVHSYLSSSRFSLDHPESQIQRPTVATMTLVAKGCRRGKVTMAPQRPSYLVGRRVKHRRFPYFFHLKDPLFRSTFVVWPAWQKVLIQKRHKNQDDSMMFHLLGYLGIESRCDLLSVGPGNIRKNAFCYFQRWEEVQTPTTPRIFHLRAPNSTSCEMPSPGQIQTLWSLGSLEIKQQKDDMRWTYKWTHIEQVNSFDLLDSFI